MVLIVEDDPVSRRALVQLLKLQGIEAAAVGSAEEAIVFIALGRQPAAVLLDIDLPGMSGLDLAHQLALTHPNIVPFFVTASDERLQELHRAFPGHYFRKPIDIKELLQTIGGVTAA